MIPQVSEGLEDFLQEEEKWLSRETEGKEARALGDKEMSSDKGGQPPSGMWSKKVTNAHQPLLMPGSGDSNKSNSVPCPPGTCHVLREANTSKCLGRVGLQAQPLLRLWNNSDPIRTPEPRKEQVFLFTRWHGAATSQQYEVSFQFLHPL